VPRGSKKPRAAAQQTSSESSDTPSTSERNTTASASGQARSAGTTTFSDFTQDLEQLLGSAQAKATTWLDQRDMITQQLKTVRDTASQLLEQLGSAGRGTAAPARRGRPAKAAAGEDRSSGGEKRGGRRRRRLSAETRRKMAEAARRRWAAQKKTA
jgi:hypothetical protein